MYILTDLPCRSITTRLPCSMLVTAFLNSDTQVSCFGPRETVPCRCCTYDTTSLEHKEQFFVRAQRRLLRDTYHVTEDESMSYITPTQRWHRGMLVKGQYEKQCTRARYIAHLVAQDHWSKRQTNMSIESHIIASKNLQIAFHAPSPAV